MTTPRIRSGDEADRSEIARLLTVLGHPTSPEAVTNMWPDWVREGNVVLVAERSDGTLAGCITLHRMLALHRARPVGRITSLVVDEGDRGSGIGRSLLDAAEKLFANWGCGLLEVSSNMRRADAHAFYERLGYERTSYRFAKTLPG